MHVRDVLNTKKGLKMDLTALLQGQMVEDINISFVSTVMSMLSAIFAAVVLRNMYVRFGRSMNNRAYFGNIFVLLSITTCAVIIIVKYSLALSLGLVGALSIVRFRAAIKEPEELVFLFLVIAFGLAFGANQFAVGFSLLGVSVLSIYFASKYFLDTNDFDRTGMIVIIDGPRDKLLNFRDNQLSKYAYAANSMLIKEITVSGDTAKLVLKVESVLQGQAMIDEILILVKELDLNISVISDVSVPA